jgi:hypothetical protein
MHARLDAGDGVRRERTPFTERDHGIEDRMQHHATGIRLVAVARDLPARTELVEHALRRGDVAVDAREAALALDDLLRTVEALLRQQCGKQAVRRGAAGMERFGHGAAVLLHAARLRCRNAKRVRHSLRIKTEQASARRAGGNGAECAGEMPAAVMMAGRCLPDPHARFEASGIGGDQRTAVDLGAIDPPALGKRKQRREDRRRGMQHDAAHMGVVEIEHVPHLSIDERGFGQAELQPVRKHGRVRLCVQRRQHRQQFSDGRMAAAGERATDPVEHAAARFVHGRFGHIFEAHARQKRGQVARDIQPQRRRAVIGLAGWLRTHRTLRA